MNSGLPDPILHIILSYEFEDIVLQSITNNDITLLYIVRIFEIFNTTRKQCIEKQLLQYACINERTDVAKYLIETYSITITDHPGIFEILPGHNVFVVDRIYYLSNLNMLSMFVETFNIPLEHFRNIFDYACVDGRLDTLRWMKLTYNMDQEYFFENNGIDIFCRTCYRGNLEVLKWLKMTFRLTYKNLVIPLGVHPSPLECAKIGIGHRTEKGQHEVIKWLKKEGLYHITDNCVIL